MPSNDEHIMEACGKARIVVKKGKVVDVGPTLLKACPLATKFSQPVINFTKEEIVLNMEDRIKRVGMFTKDREVLSNDDFVVFGASELICSGMKKGILDCAVVACDGAGTVITTSPQLVQGIGGRMSGLVKTSPIKEVIMRLEANGGKVLDPHKAAINQLNGMRLAQKEGFRRIAVTVTDPMDAEAIRKCSPGAMILGVHLTGITKEGAERIVAVADIVSGCASKWIREIAGKAALLQAGASVPVFALTREGKDLIAEKIKETQQRLLVKIETLPYVDKKCPDPLV
jgi:putative methanogenesis marker protein 8